MSQNEDQISDDVGSGVHDSRLEAFLRQASAIIAAEKGLSNIAKAKLEDLARRIHLPDELFAIGLQRLQDSNAPVGDLTAYERGFLKFLTNEFSRMPAGTVLSISMEEKAIAHAKTKFDIAAHRAEQLIEHQTRQSGFGRLSRSDAREFGRGSILDHVGEKTALETEARERIDRIGRQWGYTPQEVERLVAEKIRDNRRNEKAKRRRPVLISFTVLLCVAVIGAGGWWLYQNRESLFASSVSSATPAKTTATGIPAPDVAVISEPKTDLERLFPRHADELFKGSTAQRTQVLDSVLREFIASPDDGSAKVSAIRDWYFDESDPIVANRLVQFIDDNLAAPPKTDRDDRLHWPYRAASLALTICTAKADASLAKSRKQSVHDALSKRTATPTVDALTISSVNASIARSQWSQLIQSAFNDPARASILIQPLTEVTESILEKDQLDELVSRGVRSVLATDGGQWKNMKGSIETAIGRADDVQQMEWIDFWLDEFNDDVRFRELTSPWLARLLGVELPRTSIEVEKLFRATRSRWRNRLLQPAITRHRKLNEKLQQIRPLFESPNQKTLPDLVFLAAQSANLCLESSAVIESGRGGQESAWREFDAKLTRLDQRLRDFVFLDEVAASGSLSGSSAGFDTTGRDRDLGAFADTSASNSANRMSAIERLPKLIRRFESIPTPMAEDLARYLTSPIEVDEWIRVQRVVPELVNWPRVLLAIADELPEASAAIDQTVALCNLLTGEIWQGEKSSDWRGELSRAIFLLADEALQAESLLNRSATDDDWLRLQKFLLAAYRDRSRVLGCGEAIDRVTVFDFAVGCTFGKDKSSRADNIVRLIDAATDNEIEKVTLLNRMLLGDTISAASGQKTAGENLLDSEISLQRLWLDRFNLQIVELAGEE